MVFVYMKKHLSVQQLIYSFVNKHKLKVFLILVILTQGCETLLFPPQAHATATTGFVRIDRMGSNVTATGMVCLTPQTTATENDVQITFPGNGTQSSTSYG